MELDNALNRFTHEERSIFAEQLRQLKAEPYPIAYGLLARIDTEDSLGWFWAGNSEEGCLVTMKRLLQKRDMELIERPSSRYWCLSLLTSISAETFLKTPERRAERVPVDDLKEPLSPELKQHLLAYEMAPGMHAYQLKEGNSYQSCSINLLPTFLERIGRDLLTSPSDLKKALRHTRSLDRALELRKTLGSFSIGRMELPGARLYLSGKVRQAMADAIDFHLSDRRQEGSLTDLEISNRVKICIADDVARPPSLDDLAAALLVSKTKLCQAFMRANGMTIGSYLARTRLTRAQDLLIQSDKTIAEVAADVGFKHQSNFSLMFKRLAGQSPSEWKASKRDTAL